MSGLTAADQAPAPANRQEGELEDHRSPATNLAFGNHSGAAVPEYSVALPTPVEPGQKLLALRFQPHEDAPEVNTQRGELFQLSFDPALKAEF